jgi:hypothetical protein
MQDRYVFWFSKRGSGPQAQRTSYEDTIKRISEFSTVEGFWCTYCHLSKPSAVPNYSDFHLFKSGIRPLWEVGFLLTPQGVCESPGWLRHCLTVASLEELWVAGVPIERWYTLQEGFC